MFLSDSMASMERQEIFFEDSFRVIVSSHRQTFFGQKLRKPEGISQFLVSLLETNSSMLGLKLALVRMIIDLKIDRLIVHILFMSDFNLREKKYTIPATYRHKN